LFSDDQYLAAAHAFMRGIERRIEAGLKPSLDHNALAPEHLGLPVERQVPLKRQW
jgi:hypothetical protein